MRNWLKQLFYIRKSDRTTIMVLLVVAAVVLMLIWVTGGETEQTPAGLQDAATDFRADSRRTARSSGYYDDQPTQRPAELFPFDPNTADSTQLLRLGLREWQVRNIYKFRRAGGVYRRPADFARLYGLTVGEYRRLEPYIRIGSDYQPAATLSEAQPLPQPRRDSLRYPVKLQSAETIGLNTADTALLRRVPGIGPYYAAEIVRYGKRLGGYASIDQLDEIDRFPQEAKQYLVIDGNVKKLAVNRLSLQELRRHPYINFYQAKAIVDYRRLHGPIRSLSDLGLSRDFPADAIRRLEPYMDYQ